MHVHLAAPMALPDHAQLDGAPQAGIAACPLRLLLGRQRYSSEPQF